jgi:hypothetical protein
LTTLFSSSSWKGQTSRSTGEHPTTTPTLVFSERASHPWVLVLHRGLRGDQTRPSEILTNMKNTVL